MKIFALFAFGLLSSTAFANTSYDCSIEGNPSYKSLQFVLDDSGTLVSGSYDFLGSEQFGILAQTVALAKNDTSVDKDGTRTVVSEAFAGHDGIDFMLTLSPNGAVVFQSDVWIDCVGDWSTVSPVSCRTEQVGQ